MKKASPPSKLTRKLRCAIYTRKSTEEGLDMEFNSLDAQREACEAYIASQKSEGWVELADRYDDGGFSGGTLERPALRRLLADIEDEPGYADWWPALRDHGLRSAVGLPVLVDGEIDGALVVFASEPRAFDFASRELLEELAATLGYGLGRIRDAQEREDLLALTEAERARLRATLDSLLDPLALLDTVRDEQGRAVDLRYAEANDAAIAYNRTTRAEMIGRTMLDLFPNLMAEGPLAHYLHCAETGEPVVLDDYAFSN